MIINITVNAFAPLAIEKSNHLHLTCLPAGRYGDKDGYKADKIQSRFQKYTVQQMKFKMIDTNNKMLNDFFVDAKDNTSR